MMKPEFSPGFGAVERGSTRISAVVVCRI